MADKKSWRDYSKYGKDNQLKTTTKSTKGSWRDYSKVDVSGTVGKNISDRVNSLLENYNSYVSDYQKRTANRKYNLEDAYVSDSSSWLNKAQMLKDTADAEATSILAYMDEYKNYLNPEFMQNVRNAIKKAQYGQSNILDFYKSDNKYWQGFKDETEYGYAQRYSGKTSTELKNLAAARGDDAEKEWLTSYADSVAYNEKLNFDTVAGEQEVADLEAVYAEMKGFIENELRPIVGSPERYDEEVVNAAYERYEQFQNQYGDIRQLENLIREKKLYLNDAKKSQEFVTLSGVGDQNSQYYDPEFEKYVTIGNSLDYTVLGSTKRHHARHTSATSMDNYRAASMALAEHNGNTLYANYGNRAKIDRYKNHMKDEEFQTLAYYMAKDQEQGTNLAEQYIDSLEETLTYRESETTYAFIDAVSQYFPAIKLLYGGYAGLDQFATGLGTLFQDKDYYAPSVTQLVSAKIREDQNLFGKVIYDLVTTTSNMVPSILTSTAIGMVNPVAGAAVGAGLMGASAAGHAYQEAVNLGYDKGQARNYAVLVGASEAGLQYLMGGIGKLGSKITGKAAVNLASKFDSALARVAVQYGSNMLAEGTEEYLQEILTPLFKNIALKTDEEINLITEDAIYSFVLGALSAGTLEGGSFASNIANVSSKNQANIDAKKLYGGSTAELIAEGLASPVGSESYQNAQIAKRKMDKGKVVSGYEIRQMVNSNSKQIASEITPEAKSRLKELGETKDINNIASLVAKKVSGQQLTRAEIGTLARSQFGAQVAKEMSGIESDAPKQETATYKSLEERVGTEAKFNVSESGQATVHGTDEAISLDKVEVTKFIKDKETGKVTDMVLKVDGKEVKASEIDYADDSQSHLFSAVSQIENITPGDAQVIIRDYDPSSGQTVGEYLNGVDEAFTYGYRGYSEADLKAGDFAPNLSDVQANSAYVLGQNASKNRDTSKAEAIVRMRTAVEAEAEKAKADGKEAPKSKELTITVTNEKGETVTIDEADTTEGKQSGGSKVAQILHKLGLGTNFRFFTSYLSETMKVKDKKTGKLVPARVFLNENGVEELAPAGVYRLSDGTILIDMNAYNGKQLTLYALAHELTHFIQQWSDKKYKVLADFLVKAYEDTDTTMHHRVLREQDRINTIRKANAKANNTKFEPISYNEAFDEVVANAMMKMFDDGKLVERLTELKVQDKKLAQKLWEGFKKILNKFLGFYQSEKALFYDTDDLMQMKDAFEQLQNMFAEALVEASENFQAAQTIGFEMDVDTESVSPAVMHSEQTWSESDYVQQRDKAAQEIAKAIGVSEKKAKDYIDSVNSIAKMIAEDRSRLDYFSSPGRSSFVDNAEYGGSFDFSTLCKKRRLLTGTFTAIQKALPNTALTADEILDIRNRMKEKGLEVSCGLCYVEGSRANMGQFAKEFLRLYKQYYPDAWQPNMADVNTPDGIEWVRINHPECYEQYEYFWNHYGTLKDGDKNLFASQQKPKLYQLHTEYKGEILNKFKNDDKVEDKNLNGGIRLQSFSDFEIVHLIDTMQIIMDMSRVGLAGQAYTKVPDFAWALGDTGLKINLSLIAKGVDENGKLIFDDVEGMPIAEAMKLRDRYSKNVGTILVAFNDAQLLAAMADDRVDFIIPFHRSQWKKSQYEAMGLPAKTKDYTFMQNEKFIKPTYHEYRGRMVKDKATNYMPNEYWDFSKSGKENAEAYLEMCARNNKRPKFYKLLQDNGDGSYSLKADGSTDGYWKLLIDFKMYDNDGIGSPQMAVKPEFNMEEATRMLNDYSGGHSNFPVAQGIVDEFVKDYKNSHKGQMYSSQETDADHKDHPYSYNTLISKPDMVVTTVDINVPKNRADVVYQAKQNAAKVGKFDHKTGSVSVYVDDVGNDVVLGTPGLKHGLEARREENAVVTLKAGEILKHSIRINELTPKKDTVDGSYVLVGAAKGDDGSFYIVRSVVNKVSHNLMSMDVLYAINAKKGNRLRSMRPGLQNPVTDSTISIAELLDIVNQYFPDVLPEDVLKHYGYDARPDGILGKDALYSTQETDNISNRDLLANAFEGLSHNSEEYKLIQRYKGRIQILNELEEKLSNLNAEIRQIRFGKDGVKDTAKLRQLEAEAKNTAKLINAQDKKLLSLEASEPLRKLIEQERNAERQRSKEKTQKLRAELKLRNEVKQSEILRDVREARAALRNQKNDTAIMEKEFIRIARAYERLEAKTEANAEKDADKIASLEAALKDEVKKHRDDQKIWETEFKRLIREYEAADRSIDKLEAKIERQKANAKAKIENRNKAELRVKIRKTIRDLDKILNRGNKHKNVKEELQPVVTKALQAAEILFTDNYNTYDMLRNGLGVDLSDSEEALVKTCTQMLKDLDKMPTDGYENWQARQEAENKLKTKMSKLNDVFARERKRLNNTTVSSILGELADAYASLENSEQSYVQGAYTEAVHNFLKNLQQEVGGTIVKDMTKDQLESVYAAYKMVLNTVRNANKMFNAELKQSREQLGNAVIEEVIKAGGVHLLGTKVGNTLSQASWNNMKPIWVGNRIGSDTFGKLMDGLFKGQYDFAVDIAEAKKFKLEMDEKYHPRNWDVKKSYEFESSTGKKFNLDLQQIMSLYAYTKRGEQAIDHLTSGGFVFEKNSTVIVEEDGKKKTYIHKGATSYKLNEATLNDIINSLTEEQKAYVDEMQAYLSGVMGAKGNEVSMALYGIKMFNEQFYFPLRSSGAYMEKAKEAEMKKQQGQINLVNSGFTHSVKPKAKNPIILAGFMDVWAEHCNEMSMYHSMVLPMEDFRKVYNYTTIHDENMESASVFQTIQDAYGEAATNYIDQLYKELNAGATIDPRETLFKQFISNFKKSAVMLSGSVVVQQFSSIGRAYAVIDPRYFVGSKVNSDTGLSAVEEMKKYAPVAIIKEMGGFDTGTKGNATSYIKAEKYGKRERIKGFLTDKQYRGDVMGFLPAWADEKTWCAIWEAAKRETKAKNPDMDVKSDAFLKLAGERFSEIIEKTQVYDSVLARSANMRSKGAFMNMATAFMAEPTTTVNLIESAIRTGKAKNISRAFGAVAVTIVLNNALASIVYAMRDDDEDETFLEKYFQSFTSGMIDDINPMTYYPFLKDVWSLFQGYDVERSDMSVIADVRDALKQAYTLLAKDTSNMTDDELAEHNKKLWGALGSVLDAGCSAFGVPIKNVRRDAMGIVNAWNTVSTDVSGERNNSWNSFWDKVGSAAKDAVPFLAWTKDKSKADKLYDAIVSGDNDYLARLKSGYKDEDAYTSAVRKALRENDSRIHDAAQARYDGNTAEYKRIFNEIKNEGKFSFDDIMSAINSEESKIKGELEPDKETSEYSAADFVDAILVGDTSTAKAVRNSIISFKMSTGMSREDAEKSFESSVSSSARNAFDTGLLNEAGAKKMLMEYADMDEEDATSRADYWAFAKANPKYRNDLSEARVEKFREFAEPANISLDVFVQFVKGTAGLETIKDEWGDVEKSVRDQTLEVIDSLPLTWQQKDALYLAAELAESKIWDVPW